LAARPVLAKRGRIRELVVFVNWYFILFFISGVCSILYELVWLRLAMAQFGVTTAMVSIGLRCPWPALVGARGRVAFFS
jgi:hypothetical protein